MEYWKKIAEISRLFKQINSQHYYNEKNTKSITPENVKPENYRF